MECSFCGKDIRKESLSIYVNSKGKMFYFCSSKCDRNRLKLKRSRRKTKWTKSYRKEKAVRLKLLSEGKKTDEIKDLEKERERTEEEAETEVVKEKPKEKEVEAKEKAKKQKKAKKKKK